jgi:hypothetical protein
MDIFGQFHSSQKCLTGKVSPSCVTLYAAYVCHFLCGTRFWENIIWAAISVIPINTK